MDDATTVTNRNDEDAPADLVVLTLKPEDIGIGAVDAILYIDWYAPDLNEHPAAGGVILVRWSELQPIWNADPQAPADHGLDPLRAVEYVDEGLRRAAKETFYTA